MVVLLQNLKHFEVVALDEHVLGGVPVLRVLEVGAQRCRGRLLRSTQGTLLARPEQTEPLTAVGRVTVQVAEIVVGVFGSLLPAPRLLLELELLHRVIGGADGLASFLLLGPVLADLALVLGLAVLLVAVQQLLLLVVVTGVAPLNLLLQLRAAGLEVRGEARLVDCDQVITHVHAEEVEDVSRVLIVQPTTDIRERTRQQVALGHVLVARLHGVGDDVDGHLAALALEGLDGAADALRLAEAERQLTRWGVMSLRIGYDMSRQRALESVLVRVVEWLALEVVVTVRRLPHRRIVELEGAAIALERRPASELVLGDGQQQALELVQHLAGLGIVGLQAILHVRVEVVEDFRLRAGHLGRDVVGVLCVQCFEGSSDIRWGEGGRAVIRQ